MLSQEFRARIVISVLALACVLDAPPARARTDFDGDWSIFIVTREGPCDATLRYGVQITDGMVIYSGGMATVQGRVTRSRTLSVIVRSDNQWANGSGRLGGKRGGGAWWGQGTSGICRGTWMAERLE